MSLDTKHPEYEHMQIEWEDCHLLYEGERAIKEKGERFLPPTRSMQIDGMGPKQLGRMIYDAYKLRAAFHDFFKQAVLNYMGMLHKEPAVIKLPDKLKPLLEKATPDGESLLTLLRRINEEQLITGRLGLMADLPTNLAPGDSRLPYVAVYPALSVINWDSADGEEGESRLNLVVLDESGSVRKDAFQWELQSKYRVLSLGDLEDNEPEKSGAPYRQGVYSTRGGGTPVFVESDMFTPSYLGTNLEQIPFVFVNTKDTTSKTDQPPLAGLASMVLTLYRGEADYRQNLHMQGQDTFVTIGDLAKSTDTASCEIDQDAIRTGAGSHVAIEVGGDAKYVGLQSVGLPEQRRAIENDTHECESLSGQLTTTATSRDESGEALKIRLSAQTASLHQIALTGAAGLQEILRMIATWVGADPEQVSVTPNLEFGDSSPIDGRNILELIQARGMGAPLSLRSLHAFMANHGITRMGYEEEIELRDEEMANEGRGVMLPPTLAPQVPPTNAPNPRQENDDE